VWFARPSLQWTCTTHLLPVSRRTEAFVKTFKRDYVRISPIPNAAAALALVDSWMEDYNTVHPHSRLGYRSPREYILSQPVACPV
jgi:putative transposase